MNEIDIEEINKYWNQKSKLELEKFLLSRISEEIKYSKNGEIRVEKKSNRRYFDRNLWPKLLKERLINGGSP